MDSHDGDFQQYGLPNYSDISVDPLPVPYQPHDLNFTTHHGFSEDSGNHPLQLEVVSGHEQIVSPYWNDQGIPSIDGSAISPVQYVPYSSSRSYSKRGPVVRSWTYPNPSITAPIAAAHTSFVGSRPPRYYENGEASVKISQTPSNQYTQQYQYLANHAPQMDSKEIKWIEHKPENHAAKKAGLMKGPCIRCMIANVECRGRGENRNRCDRCQRININSYCRGPVPSLTIIGEVWIRVSDEIRADPTEGLADRTERMPEVVELTYEWQSNWLRGSYREHGSYQQHLAFSEDRWSIIPPCQVKFFHLREKMTDLKRGCMSFILVLKVLRSPSIIVVEPQHSDVNRPPQAFAIIREFIIQAEALLQEINKYIENFLREKPSELFAGEAFNLGLVWKEVTQLLAVPPDWRILRGLERLMYPLVERTPTLLENIASIGRAINAAEFTKGQIHVLEDFEDIKFTIFIHCEVGAIELSSENGTSIQDTLLRRQPSRYLTHVEREIQRHKQELERYNKAAANLRDFSIIRMCRSEGVVAEAGLLTPISTTGVVSSQSTPNVTEDELKAERTSTSTSTDRNPNYAAQSVLPQHKDNRERADASVISRKKRKPTQSDDLTSQAHRVKSPAFDTGDLKSPLVNLVSEDTKQHHASARQTSVSLGGKYANNNLASIIGEPSGVEKITSLKSPNTTQDAMEDVQMHAEQRGEVLLGPSPLQGQAPRPLEDGYNESLIDFVNSIVHIDMFTDSVLERPPPNTNHQNEQLHSAEPAQAAPDKLLVAKKKSLLSLHHLAEVFRADGQHRPFSWPMRRSMRHGVQKLSHWLKGLHAYDEHD